MGRTDSSYLDLAHPFPQSPGQIRPTVLVQIVILRLELWKFVGDWNGYVAAIIAPSQLTTYISESRIRLQLTCRRDSQFQRLKPDYHLSLAVGINLVRVPPAPMLALMSFLSPFSYSRLNIT